MARTPFYGRGPAPQIARMDMNAATAPGRAYGQMFANLGKIAADSLDKFRKNKDRKEKEDQRFETLKDVPIDNFKMLGFDVQSEDEKVQLAKTIASDPEFTAVLDKFQNAALRKLQMENLQTGIDNQKKEVATRDEISKFMTTSKEETSPEMNKLLEQYTPEQIPGTPEFKAMEENEPMGARPSVIAKYMTDKPGFKAVNRVESPAEQQLPDSFKPMMRKVADDPNLSPEAKMRMFQGLSANAQAQTSAEAELQNKMAFEAFKADLKGRVKPDPTAGIIVNDAIERSFQEIETGFATGVMSYSGFIPGVPAQKLKALTQTIAGNIGFDKLQAMRDASPTGGALGQVSERELAFLQGVFGNLDTSQTAEELTRNLKLVQFVYNTMIFGVNGHDIPDPTGGKYTKQMLNINPNLMGPETDATSEEMAELERLKKLKAERENMSQYFDNPNVPNYGNINSNAK